MRTYALTSLLLCLAFFSSGAARPGTPSRSARPQTNATAAARPSAPAVNASSAGTTMPAPLTPGSVSRLEPLPDGGKNAVLRSRPVFETPRKATFYPGLVELRYARTAASVKGPMGLPIILLAVPADASRETLEARLNDQPVEEFEWLEDPQSVSPGQEGFFSFSEGESESPALLPENEPSRERRALLEEIVRLEKEEGARRGEKEGMELRLKLWRFMAAPEALNMLPEAAELGKIDGLYSENLPKIAGRLESLTRSAGEAARLLALARERLNRYDASHRVQWVALAAPAGGNIRLEYSFFMPAEAHIGYTLRALPDKEQLIIEQEVTLRQRSGANWDDTEIFLVTAARDFNPAPAPLRPWRFSYEDKKNAKESLTMNQEVMASMAPVPAAAPPAQDARAARPRVARPAAAAMEHSTYRLWSLGKRKLADNAETTLRFASDAYAADYYYTLRPLKSSLGYLTAEVTLAESLELPAGRARFFVDDALAGMGRFALSGTKDTIFFGADPLVSVEQRDLQRSAGQQGFISKDNTQVYHWNYLVRNERGREIKVLVEDPAPESLEQSISVTNVSSPSPEQFTYPKSEGGAKVFRWKATLKPSAALSIDHKVQSASSAGKAVSTGRQ